MCFKTTMHEAATLTLIILIAVLLRRSLLSDPDAAPGIRAEGEGHSFTALAPVIVPADRPHPARRTGTKP